MQASVTSQDQKIEKPQSLKDDSQEKELLISGGGGGLAFMAGYIHAMIEIIGKEKLKEYKLGCVSAGSIIGVCLHFVLRQEELDMKYFYNEWFRKCYEKGNKKYGGLFTCGELLRDCSTKIAKMMEDQKLESMDDKVGLSMTTFNKFGIPRNEIVTQFENGEELGDALESTCGIPFLIKFGFFCRYKGQRTIDGGFTKMIPNRFENSKKVFLNVLPKQTTQFPFVWKQPKNMKTIHIADNQNISFPKDFWLWDEFWADDMFMRGILAAKQDTEQLKEAFAN